jgi:hypothetical protein
MDRMMCSSKTLEFAGIVEISVADDEQDPIHLLDGPDDVFLENPTKVSQRLARRNFGRLGTNIRDMHDAGPKQSDHNQSKKRWAVYERYEDLPELCDTHCECQARSTDDACRIARHVRATSCLWKWPIGALQPGIAPSYATRVKNSC